MASRQKEIQKGTYQPGGAPIGRIVIVFLSQFNNSRSPDALKGSGQRGSSRHAQDDRAGPRTRTARARFRWALGGARAAASSETESPRTSIVKWLTLPLLFIGIREPETSHPPPDSWTPLTSRVRQVTADPYTLVALSLRATCPLLAWDPAGTAIPYSHTLTSPGFPEMALTTPSAPDSYLGAGDVGGRKGPLGSEGPLGSTLSMGVDLGTA